MLVLVMCVREMVMAVGHRLVPMPVSMCSRGVGTIGVHVLMVLIVFMLVLVLDRGVLM